MAIGLGKGKTGSAKPTGAKAGAGAAAIAPQAAAGLARPTVQDRFNAAAQGLGQLSRGAVEAGRATRRASDATVALGRRARASRAGQAAVGFGQIVAQRAVRDIAILRERRRARAA